MKNDLTIVIPAYNEEDGIKETLLSCIKYNSDASVMVVDDYSKDRTNEIVHEMQKEYKQIDLVRNEVNRNYGGALKVGFEKFTTDYVAFLDADGTYNPKTKIYDEYHNRNLFVKSGEYENYFYVGDKADTPIRTEYLTREELLDEYKKAIRRFYFRPSYAFQTLLSSLNLSGIRRLYYGFKFILRSSN